MFNNQGGRVHEHVTFIRLTADKLTGMNERVPVVDRIASRKPASTRKKICSMPAGFREIDVWTIKWRSAARNIADQTNP